MRRGLGLLSLAAASKLTRPGRPSSGLRSAPPASRCCACARSWKQTATAARLLPGQFQFARKSLSRCLIQGIRPLLAWVHNLSFYHIRRLPQALSIISLLDHSEKPT
jgi:hypothetical protein